MDITGIFISNGGTFLIPEVLLKEKARKIKALVFDWDGVFNNGLKSPQIPNGFAESDSMGINLSRFLLHLNNGQPGPAAIITGEKNDATEAFAKREKFNHVYYKIKFKKNALDHFCNQHQLRPDEIAWFFDDILDLSISEHAGLRFYLGKPYQPLTNEYIVKHQLADYIPGTTQGPGGIRECCEVLWGMLGNYEEIIKNRTDFSPIYTQYLQAKMSTPLSLFTANDKQEIIETSM